MPYHMPPMQNQFHNIVPPVNQGNALRGVRPALSPGVAPRSYVGSGYPTVPNLQYPMAYPGGMMTHGPVNGSPGSIPSGVVDNPSGSSPGVGSSSGSQVEGW